MQSSYQYGHMQITLRGLSAYSLKIVLRGSSKKAYNNSHFERAIDTVTDLVNIEHVGNVRNL